MYYKAFLDKVKAAGVVIHGEDRLCNDLLTVDAWRPRLLAWLEQGRGRGVTFHASAAGLDLSALNVALAEAGFNRAFRFRFLCNVRAEPAAEIQKSFSARTA